MPQIVLLVFAVCTLACDSSQKTPSPPPTPDVTLPTEAADAGVEPAPADEAVVPEDERRAPVAENMLEFLPEVLDGVKARRRQPLGQKPAVHGFYPGEDRKVYNLHITGPTETEDKRRSEHPLLGKEKETKESGPLKLLGLKIDGFDAQREYDTRKKKSETVVLVNPYVEVKLTVAPTDKADEATKLLDEAIDLVGLSRLQ